VIRPPCPLYERCAAYTTGNTFATLSCPACCSDSAAYDNCVASSPNTPKSPAALPLSLPFYFKIFVTTPAPTVRPPSRIAKRSPSSMAMCLSNRQWRLSTLSPGITISTPSGRCASPVTSVVRK